MTLHAARPVELIPATPQRLWKAPAVANFALGGLGAGFYLAALAADAFEASPALALASWLAPALVLAGFAAVATEAGRPLRGARVLRRVRTSWMSRELVLGVLFAALALADVLVPSPVFRWPAGLAAIGFVLAQGFIVRRARGVTAWDVSVMPVVFLFSALLSGAGLLLAVEVVAGRVPGGTVLGGTLALLVFGMVVWLAYVTWSGDEPFVRATRPLRDGVAAVAVAGGGYVLPFALTGVALALGATVAALAAGALMVVAQLYAKWLLILAVGELRPITLANLRLERRPS
jgi:DMSO reductase anchor subunit